MARISPLTKRTRKVIRKLFRIDRRTLIATTVLALLLLPIGIYSMTHTNDTPQIDPAAYAPLLDTIAKGESRGNYNAHYGNSTNTATKFTEMTVAEVMRWQDEFVAQGSPSSAVGKYQIVKPTMEMLVRTLGLDTTETFDPALQDRMALALLEKRGSQHFIESKISREQFAANLAQEWAALPKILGENPDQSYYAGDGLNKVQVSASEVFAAIGVIESHKPAN